MKYSNPLSRGMTISIIIVSVVFVAVFLVLGAVLRGWYAWGYFIMLVAMVISIYIILLYYVRRINTVIGREADAENMEIRRDLTQNIAHELKTPVASVRGYLETILENPNLDPDKQRQFLERSLAQTERLTSLLQDISTLNKMDAQTPAYKIEVVDIANIVDSIAEETALQRSQAGISFRSSLPRPLIVHGDFSLLYGIFRNLMDNAILYAGRGATVTVSATEIDGFWHFTFCDDGIGVPSQHLDRIFERFYRVDKGRSRKLGGTGLGLAIVKNAVNIHGGDIVASNNEGGGLRFDFTLKVNHFKTDDNYAKK